MILSHNHKFIFIKTKRTAGTSLEIALSKYCRENDIITPILPDDEKIRKILEYRGPQNYEIPYFHYSLKDWGRLFLKGRRPRGFFNHISARMIQERLKPQVWKNYFKFCFERNPWDKMISWYYWENQRQPRPSISEFLETDRAYQVGGPGGIDLYMIDDQIAVDKIYLFEDLSSALHDLIDQLGFSDGLKLPWAKTKSRKDNRHYREILSDDDRDKITHAFYKEIELFNYQF